MYLNRLSELKQFTPFFISYHHHHAISLLCTKEHHPHHAWCWPIHLLYLGCYWYPSLHYLYAVLQKVFWASEVHWRSFKEAFPLQYQSCHSSHLHSKGRKCCPVHQIPHQYHQSASLPQHHLSSPQKSWHEGCGQDQTPSPLCQTLQSAFGLCPCSQGLDPGWLEEGGMVWWDQDQLPRVRWTQMGVEKVRRGAEWQAGRGNSQVRRRV